MLSWYVPNLTTDVLKFSRKDTPSHGIGTPYSVDNLSQLVRLVVNLGTYWNRFDPITAGMLTTRRTLSTMNLPLCRTPKDCSLP